MIGPVGSHALAIPGITAITPRRPQPEEVQGVVVNPPRDSRVAVRVEVVSSGSEGRAWQQPSAAERDSDPQPYAWEAALMAANVEASRTAQKLGSADPRKAVAAYAAHADWQGYASTSTSPRPAPQLLDVRA